MSDPLRLRVGPAQRGLRLDQALSQLLPGVTRRHAQRWLDGGRVRIDGRRGIKGERVESGQELEVRPDDDGAARPHATLELPVLQETPDWLALDKPAGLPSAALPGRSEETAASALLARYPEVAGIGFGPREPGLIHRLDTFTSGVLVAARSQRAFSALREALGQGQLEKRYWAIVDRPPPRERGEITAALAPDERDRRRVIPRAEGTPCRTGYRVLARGGELWLVEASAPHAYRHQVRAHLALLGCPLWGDPLYGGRGPGPRHALHARLIRGRITGLAARLEAVAPLPPDLLALLEGDGVRLGNLLGDEGLGDEGLRDDGLDDEGREELAPDALGPGELNP